MAYLALYFQRAYLGQYKSVEKIVKLCINIFLNNWNRNLWCGKGLEDITGGNPIKELIRLNVKQYSAKFNIHLF